MLDRFVDGRLFGLAETMAKIVEQHPNIIESSGEEFPRAAELIREKNEEREVTHSLRIFSSGWPDWSGKVPTQWHRGRFPITFSEKSVSGTALYKTAETLDGRGLYDSYSSRFPGRVRYGTFCRPRQQCSSTGRHLSVS